MDKNLIESGVAVNTRKVRTWRTEHFAMVNYICFHVYNVDQSMIENKTFKTLSLVHTIEIL